MEKVNKSYDRATAVRKPGILIDREGTLTGGYKNLWRTYPGRRRYDKMHQGLPAFKNNNADVASQLIPELFAGAELSPGLFIQRISEFNDLVCKKCQKNEYKKIE